MTILLVNQFFWPDSAATSQLLTDLAGEIAARGHDVHVICADGSYSVASGEEQPDIHIHRVKAMAFKRGLIGRMLSYLSFYVGAARLGLTVPRPDLVLTLTTPPLLSLLGTLLKAVRGSRHFIWEMDVYPDVAVSLGYLAKGALLERAIGLVADFSRRKADGLLALGECMKSRLIARGISPARIFVAENWADGAAIQPVKPAGSGNPLVLLYSGNLGLAHDTETIAQAMLALKASTKYRFLFTGGGPRRKDLEAFCSREGLTSVEFRPYVQRTTLGESLSLGDIGLVTQKDACLGAVVPSKVYGLLAAGRPILFIGPAEATPARIVREFACGWHIACGDTASLVRLLAELAEDPEQVRAAGRRARQVLLERYDRAIGVAHICHLLDIACLPHTATQPSKALGLIGTRASQQA